jgi:two-component system phosphate regulon response regulator PhoB
MRVLFVDDNRDILQIARIILEPKGLDIDTTDNGYEIEQKIHDNNPDIIFLDVHLQALDGRDICRRIKNNNEMKHLPVILFSSDILSGEDIVECKADAFIRKPFEINELLQKIEYCKKEMEGVN